MKRRGSGQIGCYRNGVCDDGVSLLVIMVYCWLWASTTTRARCKAKFEVAGNLCCHGYGGARRLRKRKMKCRMVRLNTVVVTIVRYMASSLKELRRNPCSGGARTFLQLLFIAATLRGRGPRPPRADGASQRAILHRCWGSNCLPA